MSWLSTDRLPRPHDTERRDVAWTRWNEITARPDDPAQVALLDALFGNSPYLTETAIQNPTFMTDLWRRGPDAVRADLAAELAAVRSTARDGAPPAAVATALRQLKRRVALAVAVADIAEAWSLEQVTGALSAFASGCLDALTASILLQLARDGQLGIGTDPEAAALTVLGMGKLGAGELNYSSDIDLILLYDRDAAALAGNDQLSRHFVRAARMLVQLMSETSADGYIFRTDLRLRPDPGSTPLAMSVQAAELYYESVGQNWERAAMIKAHPVAGNRAVGETFLGYLTPYIWRKHLDFAAIHDIHSIKRQIDAHRGGSAVKVLGHNVKLGRGGIREIEFFAQTQQLIFGGRNPALRGRATCETLRALAAAGHVAPSAADELIEAYGFLRKVEHRLQMVDDRQTHSLPNDEAGVAAIATFLGYPDSQSFQKDLLDRLHCVEGHYAHLFEEAPSLAGPGGNLVFTGTDDDPGTLGDLADAGLPRSVGGGGHRAALAPRPLPLDRHRPRPRASDRADAGPPEGAGLDRRARPGAAELRPLPRQPAGGHPALLAVQVQPRAARAGGGDHGQRARACRPSGAPHHPARFGAVARLLPAAAAGRGDARRPRPSAGERRARAGHPRPGATLGQRPALPGGRAAARGDRAPRAGGPRLFRHRRRHHLGALRPRRAELRRTTRRLSRPAARRARHGQARQPRDVGHLRPRPDLRL